jgi:hypothetical protein
VSELASAWLAVTVCPNRQTRAVNIMKESAVLDAVRNRTYPSKKRIQVKKTGLANQSLMLARAFDVDDLIIIYKGIFIYTHPTRLRNEPRSHIIIINYTPRDQSIVCNNVIIGCRDRLLVIYDNEYANTDTREPRRHSNVSIG